MRISIFGMGYVGVVCSACLARLGHNIIGVDVDHTKVAMINDGTSPIVEPELSDYLEAATRSKRLMATDDTREAILGSDVTFICVGTPSLRNGDLDLTYIRRVCENIGEVLAEKTEPHTVVVRSTVLPGTTRNIVVPILEDFSGKKAGKDFHVAMNPEFLREGSAIRDFYEPPMTVIGELHREAGEALAAIYSKIPGAVLRKDVEVAEMAKYVCNVWHATKVNFGNEIGVLSKAIGIDGRDVMDVVCADTKLNISANYLRPWFAFGGSCLPKDVKALTSRAKKEDVKVPMIESIMQGNKQHISHGLDLILKADKRKVGFLGLSFKADTDDLRESPMVELAESLIGKGYKVSIYDNNVAYSKLHGANKNYLENHIPHITELLTDELDKVVNESELLVIGNGSLEFSAVLSELPENKKVVDLTGISSRKSDHQYEGVCW